MDNLSTCRRCSLCEGRTQVAQPCGKGEKILFLCEKTSPEDDERGEAASSLEGANLKRLLAQVGITREVASITNLVKCVGQPTKESIRQCKYWFWREWQSRPFRVVVPLGDKVTGLLLTGKFANLLGRFWQVEYSSSLLAPWYDASYVFRLGQKMEEKTLLFFREVLRVAQDS